MTSTESIPSGEVAVWLTADALNMLMRKCQSLGWEVHAGYHTEASANVQRERLFLEFAGSVRFGADQ